MKNIFRKINSGKVSLIIDYVTYALLVALIFAAGLFAGLGNWTQSLNTIAFIAVCILCLYYRSKMRKNKKFLRYAAGIVVENKFLKLQVEYYERNYGRIGEDPKSKDDKEPECSAENNDQTAYHNNAEGVGGGDDE